MPPDDDTCLVDGKIIVLVEHQSTINENMPLRFLQYVARLYEQIQTNKTSEILHRCKPYAEYTLFVEAVRRHTKRDSERRISSKA